MQFLDTLDLVRREPQPDAGSDRRADHHARRTHPSRPGCRGGAAQPSTRTGVRYRDSAKRPRRRGPELWDAGDRPRPGSRGAEAYTALADELDRPRRPRDGAGGRPRSERDTRRGNGTRPGGDPAETGRRPSPYYREVPAAMVRPNPSQPRRRFDPESISTLADVDRRGRDDPADDRPAARRRPLRDHRRRAALARGDARPASRRSRRCMRDEDGASGCRRR